jgi:TonB family protein
MQFVVTEDGRVDPNSIKVVSSTHEQFGTASAKVLERAKFNPAKVGNRNVRMLLQLPIGWKLSR